MTQAFSKAIQIVKRHGPLELVRYVLHWAMERFHEHRLGIDSSGFIRQERLGAEPNEMWAGYEPTDYRSLRRVLKRLQVKPQQDVFLDYGSGKGRALIMAATLPFKRIIGIEVCEELNEIARQNIKAARQRLTCRDIELVTSDAALFELPSDATVVFLYNPFRGAVLNNVLDRIHASISRFPRALTVVYKYPNWVDNILEQRQWLREKYHIDCYSGAGEKVAIYEAIVPTKVDGAGHRS